MNVSVDSPPAEEATIGHIIAGCLLSVISLGSILGNISLWIVICRDRELRTITNMFILGLTTADLLVSVINMPVTIVSLFVGSWPWTDDLCRFFGFTNMLTLVTSVMSLCNISINRYVMVCKPIYFKRIYTKRNAVCMILTCVLISMLLSSLPLFGWAEYAFISKQMFCFCDWTKAPSYAFFMISVCFGIPFGVMTVCNAFIFRTVRASKRRVNTVSNTSASGKDPEANSSSLDVITKDEVSKPHDIKISINERPSAYPNEISRTVIQSNNNSKEQEKKISRKKTTMTNLSKKKSKSGKSRAEEIRLAMILAIVVVIFVISWLPYCVSMLLEIFARDQVHRGFHMTTLILGYCNSAVNPIIYGVLNKKFGDGLRRLLCSCCKFS